MEVLIVLLGLGVVLVLGSVGLWWFGGGAEEAAMQRIMEDDSDLPPAVLDHIPAMHELRSNPRKVESLRGKVDVVGFNPRANSRESNHATVYIAQCYIVDLSGRVHTLDEGVSAGNSEVEKNARWLANQLGMELHEA